MKYFVINENDQDEIEDLLRLAVHVINRDSLVFSKISRFLERPRSPNRFKEVFMDRREDGQWKGTYTEPDRQHYYKNVVLKENCT